MFILMNQIVFERLCPKGCLIQLCCVLSNVQTFICILIYKVLVRGVCSIGLYEFTMGQASYSNLKKNNDFLTKTLSKWTLT